MNNEVIYKCNLAVGACTFQNKFLNGRKSFWTVKNAPENGNADLYYNKIISNQQPGSAYCWWDIVQNFLNGVWWLFARSWLWLIDRADKPLPFVNRIIFCASAPRNKKNTMVRKIPAWANILLVTGTSWVSSPFWARFWSIVFIVCDFRRWRNRFSKDYSIVKGE